RNAADTRRRAEDYLLAKRKIGYSGTFVFGSQDKTIIKVRSFKEDVFQDCDPEAATFYEIRLDFSRDERIGEIVSCQCKAFQRTKTTCKHIALVLLEKKPIKFRHANATWVPREDDRDIYGVEVDIDETYGADNKSWAISENNVATENYPSVAAMTTPEARRELRDSLLHRMGSLDLDKEMLEVLWRLTEESEARCPQDGGDYWKRKRQRQQ
ncbi:hypothetical protein BGX26_003264, partial [Mortierella sp. AD094]